MEHIKGALPQGKEIDSTCQLIKELLEELDTSRLEELKIQLHDAMESWEGIRLFDKLIDRILEERQQQEYNRRLQEEIRINRKQPTVGFADSFMGDFFQALVDRFKENGGAISGPWPLLLSDAYTYGVIAGKRYERARRKAGAAT